MIRVGFFLSSCFPDEYPGGKNYMMNLFFALSSVEKLNKKIEMVLFIGRKTPLQYEKDFECYGKIVRTSLLDRKSLYWFVYKVFRKLFRTHIVAYPLLLKYDISIMSHSDIYGKRLPFKTINWVPDLQFMHLPHLWSERGLADQRKIFKDRLMLSDTILNSSYDGEKDALDYVPECKTCVIRPVYQIRKEIYDDISTKALLEKKYKFKGKYFFLPNQFWTHKNHMVVFKTIKILKSRGIDILVLCSGLIDGADSAERNHNNYILSIKKYISENKLTENIKLLGLIEYRNVLILVRHSISIINPSFFEGWSTTVEEAKSIGKNVILSNLDIHIEQDPPGSIFFDPNDPDELANILEEKWINNKGGPDYDLEKEAKANIGVRTKQFGEMYHKLILDLVKDK